MHSFHPKNLKSIQIPMGTSWLLGECMEAKGKQQLWEQKKPEVLSALKDLALIQSAESSNRIEGVEIDQQRLKPIILGNAIPKSRSEEEVRGYRRALELIHSKYKKLEISSLNIKKLHDLSQEGAGDSGVWKTKNNEIIEFDSVGNRSIRFIPVEANQITKYMDQLCLAYTNEIKNAHQPALILSALFILDFLCIHPFRDGNGRVSRLLSLLLMYQQDIHVGKYISLERIIEENKIDYYEALKVSSKGWHENKHDPLLWISFFLSTLRLAYKELALKVELSENGEHGKGTIIEKTIQSQIGTFTLRDIQLQCPNVSLQMIKKVLTDMKNNKKLILHGAGRGAKWKLVESTQ
jgi:Fic family protein